MLRIIDSLDERVLRGESFEPTIIKSGSIDILDENNKSLFSIRDMGDGTIEINGGIRGVLVVPRASNSIWVKRYTFRLAE